MSSLITNPTSQFINPLFGTICENGSIYIGMPGTDAIAEENRQNVYILRLTDESVLEKIPLPQPLLTNSAGVITYEGLPVTPWVDGAYSISIVGYDGAILYTAFYVDDPTYWLRQDLAQEPARTADGLHYDPADKHGVNLVGGAAPILSPDFQGRATAPTPAVGDSSTQLANTEFVTRGISQISGSGVLGVVDWWLGPAAPANAVVPYGQQLSKEAYAELYAIIGDNVALANGLVPDSASFYLPDIRSRYIRASDQGASRSQFAEPYKYYNDIFRSHQHTVSLGGVWYADGNTQGSGSLHGNGSGIDVSTTPAGDGETMPMTCVLLPIVWLKPSTEVAKEWWKSVPPPLVYHVHEVTGELLSSSLAQPSPFDDGAWLTPMHSTLTIPPGNITDAVTVFRDGKWLHDKQLYQARQKAQEDAKIEREEHNKKLAEREQKRKAMNDWLKQQGAPFTLDDME